MKSNGIWMLIAFTVSSVKEDTL